MTDITIMEAHSLFPKEPNLFIGNDRSISGLSKKAQVGGDWEVIHSKMRERETDRTFYLVRNINTDEHILMRICDAYPDSGYARFCVIHERGPASIDLWSRWFDK